MNIKEIIKTLKDVNRDLYKRGWLGDTHQVAGAISVLERIDEVEMKKVISDVAYNSFGKPGATQGQLAIDQATAIVKYLEDIK